MNETEKLFLIVDDEPDMCWVLETILNANGMSCKKALDGCGALDLIRRHRFELVFLDAKLPDIDGLELAESIRLLNAEIPIVLVSGYFYKNDMAVSDALDRGVISGFIAKPFQNDEIRKAIELSTTNIKRGQWQAFHPGMESTP